MWLWLSLLAFAVGVIVGRFSVRRYRHDRIAWAQRRLQLKVLSLELKSLRSKVVSAQWRTPPAKRRLVRKLPTLPWWQRRLIAWLRLYFPWLTRFMQFSPGTYIRWQTVAQILKAHGFKPRPKGKRPPREEEPGWVATLYNQHVKPWSVPYYFEEIKPWSVPYYLVVCPLLFIPIIRRSEQLWQAPRQSLTAVRFQAYGRDAHQHPEHGVGRSAQYPSFAYLNPSAIQQNLPCAQNCRHW